MNPIALLAVGAAALFALSKRKADGVAQPESADDVAAEAKRIVQESKEIVQGKRDEYSDFPGQKVTPQDAAARTKVVIDQVKANTTKTENAVDDLLAQKAAQEAERQEALEQTGVAKPKVIQIEPQVITAKPPAPKPKPQPAKPKVIQIEPQVITASPSPSSASSASSPPPGFNQTKARNAAPDMAKHLVKAKYDYNRKALKAWQIVAGIEPDGVYGPASHNALAFYVGAVAPKPLFLKGPNGPYPNTPYPWGG